jgi:hypothetical protein
MKLATIAILVMTLSGAAFAEPGVRGKTAWRVAESTNSCLIYCANQSDSCKRMCPATYNGPCTAACDNQAQFCMQACQQK